MRATMVDASTTPGSKETVALLVIRLTLASTTPGVFPSVR
jgi:hypothetical protein